MPTQQGSSTNAPALLPTPAMASGSLMGHSCRFPSGSDFSSSLRTMALQTSAHCILSIVGSLSSVTLRMPQDAKDDRLPLMVLNEALEIVSAVGTFAIPKNAERPNDVNFHIHVCVSNSKGQVLGGHLIDGTVRTTAEVVLGSMGNVEFTREPDPATGFDELVVRQNGTSFNED